MRRPGGRWNVPPPWMAQAQVRWLGWLEGGCFGTRMKVRARGDGVFLAENDCNTLASVIQLKTASRILSHSTTMVPFGAPFAGSARPTDPSNAPGPFWEVMFLTPKRVPTPPPHNQPNHLSWASALTFLTPSQHWPPGHRARTKRPRRLTAQERQHPHQSRDAPPPAPAHPSPDDTAQRNCHTWTA